LLMFIAKRLEIPLPGNQETHAKQESSTHHAQSRNPPDPLQQAYQLLGISSHATHVEIKKAYRRAMNYNHPDKLIAKGLPEKVIRQATQKTQQIRAAYESICQARRI
jgi:DnaJ like chaperone protein